MSKNISQRNDKPLDRAKSRFKTFKKKLKTALALPKLKESDRETIEALCGFGRPLETLPASDLGLRWVGAKALKEAMLYHRDARRTDQREYFLGTLIDDCGITSDRVPTVRLDELRSKTYRTLKAANLDAICVIEVHPLMNLPGGGEGRTLLFHVHFLAWSSESIDAERLAEQISMSPGWSCKLGAPPAKIEMIKPTKRDLARVCYYLLKPPHSAKNRMPSKTKPGQHLLMDTVEGYRPELALRVIEGYSQIDLRDTIFGVNGGSKTRQVVHAAIQSSHKARTAAGNPTPSTFDTWLFWYELRQRFGSSNYLPFRFVGKSLMPVLRAAKRRPAKSRPGRNQRRLKQRRVKKRSRKTL